VAATTDGGVVVFGHSSYGQLGTGTNEICQPTPELLACATLHGVRIVGCAAGSATTFLVSDEGRVFATGGNHCGQLGLDHTNDTNTPTEISAAHFGGAPVTAVAAGHTQTLLLTSEGTLYACGSCQLLAEAGSRDY
jgi:regulator of chromosome condensation